MTRPKTLLLKIALIILLAGLLELMLFMAWENSVSTLKGDAAAINMVASERMRRGRRGKNPA